MRNRKTVVVDLLQYIKNKIFDNNIIFMYITEFIN